MDIKPLSISVPIKNMYCHMGTVYTSNTVVDKSLSDGGGGEFKIHRETFMKDYYVSSSIVLIQRSLGRVRLEIKVGEFVIL